MKFIDRLPTRPGRVKITLEDGSSYFATMERADDPTVEGTPLNAENLNRLASKSGAFEDGTTAHTKPVPADAAPYAEVVEIGGMARKCKHIFNNWVRTEYSFSSNTNGNYDISNAINIPSAWVGKKVCYSAYFDNRNNTGVAHVGVVINSAVYRNFDTDIGVNAGSAGRAYVVLTIPSDASTIAFGISTNPNGATVYWREPMVEFGDAPSEYEPYFEGLRSASVTEVESVGVNLAGEPINLTNLTYDNGVYKQINADTITGQLSFKYLKFKGTSNYVEEIRTRVVYTSGNLSQEFTKDEGFDTLAFGFNGKKIDTLCYIDVSHLTNGKTYCLSVHITSIAQGSLSWCEVMLNEGITDQPYTPYTRNTLPIPEAVRNLDGYGWGVSESVYNYIDWEKKQFVKRVGYVDLGACTYQIGDNGAVGYCFTSGIGAKSRGALLADLPESIIGYYSDDSARVIFTFDLGYFTDPATFKAAMSGVMLYYELAEPIITDISDLLPADNLIGVEGGGTVRMVNEHGDDVPNTIVFYEGKNEVVGAETFVGNLHGTAARAMADGEGRPFPEEDESFSGCFYRMVGGVKEWVNPPMQIGVDYRTTERMNGKAVYKKRDSSGKLLMRLDGESEWTDYVYNATNATNATNDGEGDNIAATYMKKSEAAILARVATGTYVGQDGITQAIITGFMPKFITAIRQTTRDRFFTLRAMVRARSMRHTWASRPDIVPRTIDIRQIIPMKRIPISPSDEVTP